MNNIMACNKEKLLNYLMYKVDIAFDKNEFIRVNAIQEIFDDVIEGKFDFKESMTKV